MVNNISVWLDETVKRHPEKIVFADEKNRITYTQLRKQALKLAGRIIALDVFKSPIAVIMERSINPLIAFLGIAYSGNFYTIIDIDMPDARKEKIIEVFQPKVVVTTLQCKDMVKSLCSEKQVVVCIDDLMGDIEDEENVLKRREKCCDVDLLYTLFTSGSTGIPKGVTISHRSVIDYIQWVEETFEFTAEDTFGNQAPFYFDNSIFDIYTTIKTGATMEIIPKLLFAQPIRLLEYLKGKKINTIFWVPSALVIVANLHALKKVDLKSKLKRVFFAGEVMPIKQLNEWRKYVPDAMYANLYGPTEGTDVCVYYILDREFQNEDILPIGYPTKNTEVFVLNERDELVKGQEIGELCVRGASLSFGYYNNWDKTNEAFVQNPLNTSYIEYIYRTGDLVRYNEYGELVYLSRKDFQIKHMGHRIELGEIESVASGIEGIRRCCCLYDDSRKKIVLIYEGSEAKEKVLPQLKEQLPEYMIPGKYIQLEEIPLNGNGKIDRVLLKTLL